MATASSGKLVPNATTVNPIIKSLTPKANARFVPPQTTSLALDTSITKDMIRRVQVLALDWSLLVSSEASFSRLLSFFDSLKT